MLSRLLEYYCIRSIHVDSASCCLLHAHCEPPLLQVNSEFQAFKHIKITAPGEMARATKSLEATLALQPTLILTNSLPCSLDVVVWQVSPVTSPMH